MELIIPLVISLLAFLLLFVGMLFKYQYGNDELFLFSLIFSTIFFFVGGVCFLGVTFIDPITGLETATTTYNWMVWLMAPFGFVPILLMFEHSFDFGDE